MRRRRRGTKTTTPHLNLSQQNALGSWNKALKRYINKVKFASKTPWLLFLWLGVKNKVNTTLTTRFDFRVNPWRKGWSWRSGISRKVGLGLLLIFNLIDFQSVFGWVGDWLVKCELCKDWEINNVNQVSDCFGQFVPIWYNFYLMVFRRAEISFFNVLISTIWFTLFLTSCLNWMTVSYEK